VYLGQRHDLLARSEVQIAQLGVGRKFQKPSVFPDHSVRENLALAVRGHRGLWQALRYRPSLADRRRIDELLETIGLTAVAGRRAGGLSHGQKQWLEIGMLLAQEPRLLLIDEPVAGMTQQETERTAQLLTRLAGASPSSSWSTTWRSCAPLPAASRVLHEGRLLMEGSIDAVQADARVREVYLGEAC
jgi:urea transport system ATP-binding protein